jgi:hypothetical protein
MAELFKTASVIRPEFLLAKTKGTLCHVDVIFALPTLKFPGVFPGGEINRTEMQKSGKMLEKIGVVAER